MAGRDCRQGHRRASIPGTTSLDGAGRAGPGVSICTGRGGAICRWGMSTGRRICSTPGALSAGRLSLDRGGGAAEASVKDPAVLKIGQNIKRYELEDPCPYGIRMAPVDDTMLLSYALNAGRA